MVGTRPEAIKMAPVIIGLKSSDFFSVKVCVTGQHRELLDQVFALFGITPDFDFNLMTSNQSLTQLSSRMLISFADIFENFAPDWVLVHGDTTTSMVASISALYHRVKVAHVEAGLRTNDIYSPWPEEANRQLISRLASLHFCPSETAKYNLLNEGVPTDMIHITGNTVIDALLKVKGVLESEQKIIARLQDQFSFLNKNKRTILITGHRRENFGAGFEAIFEAVKILALRSDIQIIYPVHPNPNVFDPVHRILGGIKNIHLTAPLDYLSFVYLLSKSCFVLTDSGGIQEEAPSLGKPVLVMRDTTERPEAVAAGTAKLVGCNKEEILSASTNLLDDRNEYDRMAKAMNPYGDGHASERILGVFSELVC